MVIFGTMRPSQAGNHQFALPKISIRLGTSIIRTPELEVPHPRLAARRFVLVPLAELAPALRHPALHRSITMFHVERWAERAMGVSYTAEGY